MAKILVIDDDAAMRRTVRRMLTHAGHDVIEAADGLQGMNLFRTNRPDIVVTDIFMPQNEGFEFIMNLRQESPTALILAISGGPTGTVAADPSQYLDMATGLGANAMLAKPFQSKDLLREVDKLLGAQTSGP